MTTNLRWAGRARRCAATACVVAAAACAGSKSAPPDGSVAEAPSGGFADRFDVAPSDWTSTGRNPYYILEPGYVLALEGQEDGEPAALEITVLAETRMLDGVETRIVEERETHAGKLVEVSRNYFAMSRATGDVYYFGEDVDIYKHGKVVGHGGSWHAGETGARFGLMMPAAPRVGARYCQEVAPGVAMDRAEITSVSETFECPAGKFEGCVKTEETTPLEPGDKEHKLYAPGVGLLVDGGMRLTRYGKASK